MKTDKGVKELELVKSDKAGVTLAVLSYDDANRPGEFTSTFVSTEDMASVIVDGKETQLARPTEGVDIFEGKVAVPAKSGLRSKSTRSPTDSHLTAATAAWARSRT